MTQRAYPNLATFFDRTNIKQDDFAAELGISASKMSRIKNGLAQPSLDLAIKIADKAHVPLESLIRHAEEAKADA